MQNETVRKVICCTVLASLLAANVPLARAQEDAAVSSTTAVAAPDAAAGPAQGNDVRVLNTAISDMNDKIDVIQTHYSQLNEDIENLRSADSALRKMIVEDRLSLPDPKRLKSMEATMELIRNDLAQAREELAALRTESDKKALPQTKEEQLLRSPWVGVSALGLALIALIVH
jgi:predicted  nucleic acid-binding Zn-ribbon protein